MTVRVGRDARMDMPTIQAIRPFLQAATEPVTVRVNVNPSSPPPSGRTRRAIEEELFDPERVLAVALVHTESGMRARLVRRILGFLAATRGKPPVQVFDDLGRAQSWLDSHHAAREPID